MKSKILAGLLVGGLFVASAFVWAGVINFWLTVVDKPPVFPFWGGLIIGLLPRMIVFGFVLALVTFVASFFI